MTRFVAFCSGDYARKTNHLSTLQHGALFLLLQHAWQNGGRIPLEPESRAAIARMTVKDWQKIAPVVGAFFDASGYNKRAAEEVAKAEALSAKRAIAGKMGGHRSGTAKAIASNLVRINEATSNNSKIKAPTASVELLEQLRRK